ncbi:hypothetical protein H4R21_004312 [Coemansia helicoidea]|uniref:Uncharacterized protein n=2 Tax=Coemansia TaxID=4863 RepID=A0ACC1KZ84_9FUNG|nr:hypothetical protein H4R21_004312 [Coemansia helicoidea]
MALASLAGLPCDVLVVILERLTADAGRSLGSWKESLPLLAVCRRWRAYVLHRVYRTAIFGDGPGIDATYLTGKVGEDMTRAKNARSNMPLIVSARMQHLVKSVVISLIPVSHSFVTVEDIRRVLDTHPRSWPSATSLYVSFPLADSSYALDELYPAVGIQVAAAAAADTARALAAALPGVRTLGVTETLDNGVLNAFLQVLGRELLGRLRVLNWRTHAQLGDAGTADIIGSLESCDLYNVSVEGGLPRLRPESLKTLELHSFRNGFSWRCFQTSGTGRRIVFSSLERLHLSGQRHGVQSEAILRPPPPPGELCQPEFPRLRNLKVDVASPTAEAFRPFASSPLTSVSFEGSPGDALKMQALGFDRLDQIIIDTTVTVLDSIDAFYRDSTELFGLLEHVKRPMFILCLDMRRLDPAKVYWPHIIHLTIASCTVDDLGLNLVAKAPDVASLLIQEYQVGEGMTAAAAAAYFADLEQRYPGPSPSKVVAVELMVAKMCPDNYAALAERLFRRHFPRLTSFRFRRC